LFAYLPPGLFGFLGDLDLEELAYGALSDLEGLSPEGLRREDCFLLYLV